MFLFLAFQEQVWFRWGFKLVSLAKRLSRTPVWGTWNMPPPTASHVKASGSHWWFISCHSIKAMWQDVTFACWVKTPLYTLCSESQRGSKQSYSETRWYNPQGQGCASACVQEKGQKRLVQSHPQGTQVLSLPPHHVLEAWTPRHLYPATATYPVTILNHYCGEGYQPSG